MRPNKEPTMKFPQTEVTFRAARYKTIETKKQHCDKWKRAVSDDIQVDAFNSSNRNVN